MGIQFSPQVVMADTMRAVQSHTRLYLRDLVVELAAATPKDTGWAAANWLFERHGETFGSGGEEIYGSTEPKRADKLALLSGALAMQRESVKLIMRSRKVIEGESTISNSTVYIGALNSGTSHKAPSQFVEKTIEQVTANYANDVISFRESVVFDDEEGFEE